MSKKEVSISNEQRVNELNARLEDVVAKRDELISEVNQLNKLFLKLQGALELLDIMENEKIEDKENEKSD